MDGRQDLVIVVADKNMEATFRGLLRDPRRLAIRPIQVKGIFVHPGHDSGLARDARAFATPFLQQCHHALIVLDYHGSGFEQAMTAEVLSKRLTQELSDSGWEDRAAVIVIAPELENWVWSRSPHVEEILGWKGKNPSLREFLRTESLWGDTPKPLDPKKAMEYALYRSRVPRSSSLYEQLAMKVSLQNCTDPAFIRLRGVLQRWFPAG